MAALTEDRVLTHTRADVILQNPVATGVKIYRGALLKIKANGYLAPMAAEAGAKTAGFSLYQVDNTSGANGDLNARYWTQGVFPVKSSGLAQTNLGDPVYGLDDQTVNLVQGANEPLVGTIVEVISATEAMVKIDAGTE